MFKVSKVNYTLRLVRVILFLKMFFSCVFEEGFNRYLYIYFLYISYCLLLAAISSKVCLLQKLLITFFIYNKAIQRFTENYKKYCIWSALQQ